MATILDRLEMVCMVLAGEIHEFLREFCFVLLYFEFPVAVGVGVGDFFATYSCVRRFEPLPMIRAHQVFRGFCVCCFGIF